MKTNAHPYSQSEWFDTEQYPFHSNFLQVDQGHLHYVDEGKGETLLFVHGTPAWSFLYRKPIQALATHFRCVAPDHLGFGLSDKPVDGDYRPEAHARNLEKLIDALDLKDITLVVHDFGGPIGLSYALAHPEKIKKVVLLNTWLWETASNPAAQKVDRILQGGLGRFLYLRLNFSPNILLKQAFADRSRLTRAVHQHYTRIFPKAQDRYGLLRIGQALVGESDWYGSQWEKMDRIANKPFLIIWGMKDTFILPEYLEKWEAKLTNFRTEKLNCGHFIQEEEPERMIQEIRSFMSL